MMSTQQGKEVAPWRKEIESLGAEFAKALPAQMPSERFVRVVCTAVQLNPDLLAANRQSLFAACMKAAQDGLLPDGREGALVVYNTKTKIDGVEKWVKVVQWSPMVAGLMKKARNSGEISGISAAVVYKHDFFRYVRGDEEKLEHVPNLEADDDQMIEANATGAYCIIRLKDGGIIRGYRSRKQIMTAKSQSKAQNSLMWTKFWEEGWCKVAIRYTTKFAPSSADRDGADAFMRAAERDDEAYDFSRVKDVTPKAGGGRLDEFVAEQTAKSTVRTVLENDRHDPEGWSGHTDSFDPETGEVEQQKPKDDGRGPVDQSAVDAQDMADDAVSLILPGTKKPQLMPRKKAAQELVAACSQQVGPKAPEWLKAALTANAAWLREEEVTLNVIEGLIERFERDMQGGGGLDV